MDKMDKRDKRNKTDKKDKKDKTDKTDKRDKTDTKVTGGQPCRIGCLTLSGPFDNSGKHFGIPWVVSKNGQALDSLAGD